LSQESARLSRMNNFEPRPLDSKREFAFRALPEVWSLIRPQRRLLVLGFLLMTMNRVAGLVLPASTKPLVDEVIVNRQAALLVPLVGLVLIAGVVQAITSFALTQILSKAACRAIAELRIKVQRHIGSLPVSYYDSNRIGALASRIMEDAEGIRHLLETGMLDFLGGLLTAAFALVILLRISPVMTLITTAILCVFIATARTVLISIRPIIRESAQITAELTGRLTESLAGIRAVKIYQVEQREHVIFRTRVQHLLRVGLSVLTKGAVANLVLSILLVVATAVVMLMGAHLILSSRLTVGGFFTYTLFLGYLVTPLSRLPSVGTQLIEALTGLERAREVLNEVPEDEIRQRTTALADFEGKIEFQKVSFGYSPHKTVLHQVSFECVPGTVTALVGPSGAGKSTIINLAAGFYDPSAGRILVDGLDLSAVRLDQYRAYLGVVLQEPFLFEGTIRENVMLARPLASSEDFRRACHAACLDEFAQEFEHGYETIIGERGVKLSGGQRQRVTIAQAVLANPRVLLLDEATSSLDSESEALIQHALSTLMQGRTTIVIAHRLSTIRLADQIIVIEGGRITEQGNHQSLIQQKGTYRKIYDKQQSVGQSVPSSYPGEGSTVSS
jgi:ABC-type multidrug transport system fused ATPase/permease subunit